MSFNNFKNLYYGISFRKDGSMKNNPQNRLSFFKAKGFSNRTIISADLIHQDKVVVVDELEEEKIVLSSDALITNNKKQIICLTVADCLPVYFYDQKKQVIALAHAGWRGVILNIAQKVIDKFINNYQSNPEDILVFIGPHIKKCHFEVKSDVSSRFTDKYLLKKEGKIYVDLSQVVLDQLLSRGLDLKNIKISNDCTYCLKKDYFSYRRDKPKELKTMITYIGLK